MCNCKNKNRTQTQRPAPAKKEAPKPAPKPQVKVERNTRARSRTHYDSRKPVGRQQAMATEIIPVVYQQEVIQNTIVQQKFEIQGVEFTFRKGSMATVPPRNVPVPKASGEKAEKKPAAPAKKSCGCRK